jgi:hypothetical protein
MFSKLFKALSIAKDISTLASGDSKKIKKRVKNKVKAKVLNKVLAKSGFWRW